GRRIPCGTRRSAPSPLANVAALDVGLDPDEALRLKASPQVDHLDDVVPANVDSAEQGDVTVHTHDALLLVSGAPLESSFTPPLIIFAPSSALSALPEASR